MEIVNPFFFYSEISCQCMKSIVVISCITVAPDTEKSSSSVFTGKNLIDLLSSTRTTMSWSEKEIHIHLIRGQVLR